MRKKFKFFFHIVFVFTLTSSGFAKDDLSIRTDLFRETCDRGAGPWYIIEGQEDNGNRIQITRLDRGSLSFLKDKGTVLFCEGESFFSGLVTTNEINFVGYGNRNRIIVMPVQNYYFNILSLRQESLNQLFEMLEITQNDLTLVGLDIREYPSGLVSPESFDELKIYIENVTFTQDNPDGQKFKDNDINNVLTPEFGDINFFETDLRGKARHEENIDGHGPAAIQINRESTNLVMDRVVFKEHSVNGQIMRLHTNLTLKMNDVVFSNNKNNLLLATGNIKYADIENIEIINNIKGSLFFYNNLRGNTGDNQISFLDGVISKNASTALTIIGMSTEIQGLSFVRNGGTDIPDQPDVNTLQIIANEKDNVNIQNSNFIENNNFDLFIHNGWGSISESNFMNNYSPLSILHLSGIEHKVIDSNFEKNEIAGALGLIAANSQVSLIRSYVVDNNYSFPRNPEMPFSLFSIIDRESVAVPTYERYIDDPIDPRQSGRSIKFKDTYFQHSLEADRDEVSIIGFYDLDGSGQERIYFERFDEGVNTKDCFWDGNTFCR
tara:strand:+ start:1491 stop:3143 length:1653 start_codon:yes stop_codon:yes gene_type:complete